MATHDHEFPHPPGNQLWAGQTDAIPVMVRAALQQTMDGGLAAHHHDGDTIGQRGME